ncbi:MAG: DegV family EDD domain-containing protein [Acidobacteria bacterium]|nr:DegV family EDD domain-containing protein [Acidobacteriota bacterium]
MPILYLNGRRLRSAILAGAQRVLEYQEQLNQINVFPVPDGDTGTNMAVTMKFAAEGVLNQPSNRMASVCASLRESVLNGARGNSGAILAQFFQALAGHLAKGTKITAQILSEGIQVAVSKATKAISEPKEGTILTVMRRWADYWNNAVKQHQCLARLLAGSLDEAKQALNRTKEQMPILAERNVVDAGAQGFVAILEGIHHFTETGRVTWQSIEERALPDSLETPNLLDIPITFSFCTEAGIRGSNLDPNTIRNLLVGMGDSLIVAGEGDFIKVHIHTDEPQTVFAQLSQFGNLERTKAEDMKAQYAQRLSEAQSGQIALVVDSSCDLPTELLLKHQVRVVPVQVTVDQVSYLDRIEITPEMVYRMMAEGKQPKTSQPAPGAFLNAIRQAAQHHEKVLVMTLSGALSGTYQAACAAAEEFPDRIEVFDSHSAAGGLGILVQVAIQALESGADLDTVLTKLNQARANCHLLVSLKTIDYAKKSGRIAWYKAGLAKFLGLVPILSVEKGLIVPSAVARKGPANLAKLVQIARSRMQGNIVNHMIISHAQAPEQAQWVADQLQDQCSEPISILAVSPTVGVHVGPGTVALAFLSEAQ